MFNSKESWSGDSKGEIISYSIDTSFFELEKPKTKVKNCNPKRKIQTTSRKKVFSPVPDAKKISKK